MYVAHKITHESLTLRVRDLFSSLALTMSNSNSEVHLTLFPYYNLSRWITCLWIQVLENETLNHCWSHGILCWLLYLDQFNLIWKPEHAEKLIIKSEIYDDQFSKVGCTDSFHGHIKHLQTRGECEVHIVLFCLAVLAISPKTRLNRTIGFQCGTFIQSWEDIFFLYLSVCVCVFVFEWPYTPQCALVHLSSSCRKAGFVLQSADSMLTYQDVNSLDFIQFK